VGALTVTPHLQLRLHVAATADATAGFSVVAPFQLESAAQIGGDRVFPDLTTGQPDIPDELPVLFGPIVTPIPVDADPLAQTSTRWSRLYDIRNTDGAIAVVADGRPDRDRGRRGLPVGRVAGRPRDPDLAGDCRRRVEPERHGPRR
jgi:hypothetical protein